MRDAAYEVWFTLVIDRPELRDASFRSVAPGTKTPQIWRYKSRTAAVGVFNEMLAGRWDFSSEYIAAVSVVQRRPNASTRTVRRRVERERVETGREHRMAIIAVGGARRRAALGADGWLYTRNIVDLPVRMPREIEEPSADDLAAAA